MRGAGECNISRGEFVTPALPIVRRPLTLSLSPDGGEGYDQT